MLIATAHLADSLASADQVEHLNALLALFVKLPLWLQAALAVGFFIVTTASAVADFLDRYAKAKVARGEPIPAWLEAVGALAHLGGFNFRKGTKLAGSAVEKARGEEPKS